MSAECSLRSAYMRSDILPFDTLEWLKLKTDITIRISVINYPYRDIFLTAPAYIGRNQGSQGDPYNSITIRDRKIGLAQIERGHLALPENQIKT